MSRIIAKSSHPLFFEVKEKKTMRPNHRPLYGLIRNSLLLRSVTWLSGLSLLSSGLAWSQTDAFVDTLGSTPAPVAQTPPPAPTPAPSSNQVLKPPKVEVAPPPPPVATPAPRPVPVATPAPAPRPAPVATPPRNSQPLPPPTVAVPQRTTVPNTLRDQPPAATQTYVDTNTYTPQTKPQQSLPRPNVVVVDRQGQTTTNGQRPPLPQPQNRCQTQVQNGRLAQADCGTAQPGLARTPVPPPTMAIPTGMQQAPRITARQQPPGPLQSSPKSTAGSYLRQVVPPTPLAYLNPLGNSANRPAAYPNNNNRGLLFPLSIPAAINSTFGWRMHPIFAEWRMHTGTDIAVPQDTPVLASYQGQVAIADYVGGYGNMVILRHEDGSQESRYAHLSQIFVQPGEWVEQGEVIGLVGSTGNSTGPHLHFEWRHLMGSDWVPVDAGPHLEWALAEMRNVMTASLPEEERIKAEMGKIALGSGMLMLPRAGETEITPLNPETLEPEIVEEIPPLRQPLYRLDPLSGQPLPNTLDPALQADLGF